jgi:hypothetical protein
MKFALCFVLFFGLAPYAPDLAQLMAHQLLSATTTPITLKRLVDSRTSKYVCKRADDVSGGHADSYQLLHITEERAGDVINYSLQCQQGHCKTGGGKRMLHRLFSDSNSSRKKVPRLHRSFFLLFCVCT